MPVDGQNMIGTCTVRY